mgnify:CR=1 FL=1
MSKQRKTRVLVLDDQVDTAVFIEIALSVAGFEPVVCTEHPERFFDQNFDVALIDLLLADDNTGIPLIRTLSERGLKVVAMTGLPDDADLVSDAVQAGACLVVHKPFDLSTLRTYIRCAITGETPGPES